MSDDIGWIYDARNSLVLARNGAKVCGEVCNAEVGATLAAAPEMRRLIARAIDVLQRHAPPKGLSDHDAMTELYLIFDGPDCRAALDKAGGRA